MIKVKTSFRIIQQLHSFSLSLFFLCFWNTAIAQINMDDSFNKTEFGTEYGERMNMQMDSLDRDSTGKKKVKIVPVDIHAWTIDEKYGNRIPMNIDTAMHQFNRRSLSEGKYGQFNHLANLGSPRLNRIYMEREESNDFIFLNPFDAFIIQPKDFMYYNTKSPYMNILYNWAGSKNTGYDHVKATYTNNIGKRANFGGLFDYMYGPGYYNNQATSHMNASAWVSYINDKYDLHISFSHNYMKMMESGGISDDRYITNPEMMSRNYTSNDIPTWLNNNWMRQENNIIHLNHKYNIGFYREEGEDSASYHEVFIPVTSIFHTFDFSQNRRNFTNNGSTDNYHTHNYLSCDTTDETSRSIYFKNLLGISLREGFNKYMAAGLNVYVGFENKSYTYIDIDRESKLFDRNKKENNVLLGGQIIRTQGKILHYNIDGEFTTAGDDLGDFTISGNGELNIPVKFGQHFDTLQLNLNGFVKNTTPPFFYRHFHAKNAWWDKDYDKTFRTRIAGFLTIPSTHTTISLGIENIKNYAYFANTGLPYTTSEGLFYSNEIKPMQESDNIQIMSFNLKQDLNWKILHFDNNITIQKTTDTDVLPLPIISLYSNLYLQFNIVKNVLKAQLGADMTYFTKYYAPDYSPVMTQFMIQNKANQIEIGNYPLISVYANIDLKRLRAYIQYYHANQSTGRYFWAPGYPMNPSALNFGISWNFYD